MSKKIIIGSKPLSKPLDNAMERHSDLWVEKRAQKIDIKHMKRLTIDISEELHRLIKIQCAMKGKKIADELRALLQKEYGSVKSHV